MNDFDMDGIRSQILQAFRSSTRSDFQVTLKLADDFSNASVTICVYLFCDSINSILNFYFLLILVDY